MGRRVGFILVDEWIGYLGKIGGMMRGRYIGGGVKFGGLRRKFKRGREMI